MYVFQYHSKKQVPFKICLFSKGSVYHDVPWFIINKMKSSYDWWKFWSIIYIPSLVEGRMIFMWKRHWIDYLINALILFTIDYPELVWFNTMEIDEDFNWVYLRWKKVVVKKEEGILIMKDLN